MDSIVMGSNALMEPKSFRDDNLFQKSGLYSLCVDNLAYPLYAGASDLHSLIPRLQYTPQPNLVTVQMQLPYPFADSPTAHLIKDLDARVFAESSYLSLIHI